MKGKPDPERELQKLQTWVIQFIKENQENRRRFKMFKLSMPTKQQLINTAELVVVTFVLAFVPVWTIQPDPFSKAALIAAGAAGLAAIYRLVKSFVTTL
jgi:hypothetical protein